jgi:hypothetical protein
VVLPILRKVSFKSDFGNRGLFVNTAIRNFSSPNDQVMSPGRTNFTSPDSQTVAARRSPDSVPQFGDPGDGAGIELFAR